MTVAIYRWPGMLGGEAQRIPSSGWIRRISQFGSEARDGVSRKSAKVPA